jgi:hypothetical protein
VTWLKLSDDYSDDCWELSDEAYRLHTEALNWIMRKLTRGVILKSEMLRWAKHPEAADELVQRGYWLDKGDRFLVVHQMAYQRTPEKVLAQSEANTANRAKGKARPVHRKTESSVDSSDDSSDERDRTGQDSSGQEGVPKNNGAEPFSPTPAQLRKIDREIQRGYES